MVAAYQAIGTFAGNASTLSPSWPTHQTDDVGFLVVEAAGGTTLTLTVPAGFQEAVNSPQSTGAGTAGTQVRVFWCRATSSAMTAPTITASADHLYGGILTVRGAQTWGDPFDGTAGGVKTPGTTTSTIPGFTPATDNIAYIGVSARDTDSAAAAYSAESNASLTSLTERLDAGDITGGGGGLGIYSATKGAAGAISSTTSTVSSSINAYWSGAIKSAISPIYPGQGAAGGCRVIWYEGFDLPDASAVTALPVGAWTATTTGATATIQNGGLRCLTSGVTGAFGEGGAASTGYPLSIGANWELQYEFQWVAPATQSFPHAGFGDTVDLGGIPHTGVCVEFDNAAVYVLRRVAGAQATVATAAFAAGATRRNRVRFRRAATTLFVKVWALPDPEPAAWTAIGYNDSTGLSNASYARLIFGVLGGNVAGVNNVTFDNAYISVLDRAGRRVRP